MWNLKYHTNELIYKTETESQTYTTDMVINVEREYGRNKLEVSD